MSAVVGRGGDIRGVAVAVMRGVDVRDDANKKALVVLDDIVSKHAGNSHMCVCVCALVWLERSVVEEGGKLRQSREAREWEGAFKGTHQRPDEYNASPSSGEALDLFPKKRKK